MSDPSPTGPPGDISWGSPTPVGPRWPLLKVPVHHGLVMTHLRR